MTAERPSRQRRAVAAVVASLSNANYTAPDATGTLIIEQAETTTVVTCPVSVIYTGVALEPCTAEVTGPALTQSLPVVYADNTDAGTASASATYGGSLNYLGSTNSTTFEIGRPRRRQW